jgi:hypothetical protein
MHADKVQLQLQLLAGADVTVALQRIAAHKVHSLCNRVLGTLGTVRALVDAL